MKYTVAHIKQDQKDGTIWLRSICGYKVGLSYSNKILTSRGLVRKTPPGVFFSQRFNVKVLFDGSIVFLDKVTQGTKTISYRVLRDFGRPLLYASESTT